MYIKLKSLPRGFSRTKFENAIYFYGQQLFSNQLVDRISIDVKWIKDLEKNYKMRASCIWEDRAHKPREFSIEIDKKLGQYQALRFLAHEMIHVKQYAKGEMTDLISIDGKLCKWHGDRINYSNVDYFDQPWEIEAYGREVGLYNKFLSYWTDYKNNC